MSNGKTPTDPDKALWRRLSMDSPPETGVTGSDANLIAALVEGRLDDRDRAALEARMAASAAVRAAVHAVWSDPGLGEPAPPPADLAERAHEAYGPGGRARAGAAGWLRLGLQWATAAAALTVAAYVGFDLGQETRTNAARIDALVHDAAALDFDAGDDVMVRALLAARKGGDRQ